MYKRVVLKLSGEVLKGEGSEILSPEICLQIAKALIRIKKSGVELAVVIGGGNLFRGRELKPLGISHAAADFSGMLATVMNGLLLADYFQREGLDTELLSAIDIPRVVKSFTERRGLKALQEGKLLLLVGGTGNPFFTTDSAAALRAAELSADAIVKATKVDGVYDRDPEKDSKARRFERLTFSEAIEKNLQVMDAAAFALCNENAIPLIVCKMDDLLNGKLSTFEEMRKAGTVIEV